MNSQDEKININKDNLPISKVEIIGLHGSRNITAIFTSPVKILVDENGSGKTTLIYLLVNLLNGNVSKLRKYIFKEISIYFGEQKISISKNDLKEESKNSLFSDKLISSLSSLEIIEDVDIERVIVDANQYPFRIWHKKHFTAIDLITDDIYIDPRELFEYFQRRKNIFHKKSYRDQTNLFEINSDKISDKIKKIREFFPYKVLYFPTYRLVEDNIISISNKNRREQLIQFGMSNVEERFKKITEIIRQSSVEWYSRINGRMLEELIGGIDPKSIDYSSVERPEALTIVLDRLGDNISEKNKTTIIELVKNNQIEQDKFTSLAYFLSNLIEIYEQQKYNDDSIKEFVRVTNGYFENKKIIYDESKLDIYLINNRSDRRISLEKLSSGEKQIVSIFSKLYLGKPEPYAIFFDEPELSLSIEWQKKLLQDITNSSKCKFLLAATHSPFIFENDLVGHADVLDVQYIESEDTEQIEF